MVTITVDTSNILDGQPIDAADVTLPISQLKTAIEDTLNDVQHFDKLGFGAAQSATIASGAITATKSHVNVDTEGAASTDDLDTINGGVDGRILLLRNSGGHTVVLKHNTGNIYTSDGTNFSLDSAQKWCLLLYVVGSLRWLLLASGGGAAAAGGISYDDIMLAQVFS